MSALERCVGDVQAFEGRYWGRRPLLKKRAEGTPSPFADLATLGDFDSMITSLALRLPSFRMVRDGKTLPVSSFTRSERGKNRVTEGVIDPSLVFERFTEGATVVLEGLHKYWRPLRRFARDLEVDLGHRVQINAYVTPPGSRGFATHRDDHDVFVLQISGSKRWVVYDEADPDLVLIEDEISEGDALYIPLDFPHAATTAKETSVHLTVGVLTFSGVDVLSELMKMAEDEPLFRQRLPLRPASDPKKLEKTVKIQLEDLRTWLATLDLRELSWRITRRLLTTGQETLAGMLPQLVHLDEVGDSSLVKRRSGAICVPSLWGPRLRVLLADRELEMPAGLEPAMRFIAEQDQFRVADMGGGLDLESRLVLIRRLIREGLLEITQ